MSNGSDFSSEAKVTKQSESFPCWSPYKVVHQEGRVGMPEVFVVVVIVYRELKNNDKTIGLLYLLPLNSVSNKILLADGLFPPISLAHYWTTILCTYFLTYPYMPFNIIIVCLHIFFILLNSEPFIYFLSSRN